MYLFIFDDGSIKSVKTVKLTDLQASEEGMIEIIDISLSNNPRIYMGYGNWSSLEEGD